MDAKKRIALRPKDFHDGVSPREGAENHPAVQRIATFAAAASREHLTPEVRQLYKRNVLDSLGCGISALPGPPFKAMRERFEEYGVPGRRT